MAKGKKKLGYNDELKIQRYLHQLLNEDPRPSASSAQRRLGEKFKSLYEDAGVEMSLTSAKCAFTKFKKPGKNIVPQLRAIQGGAKENAGAKKAYESGKSNKRFG